MTLFSLVDVSVVVPSRRLIDSLTVEIPAGTVTALVGRNGSGKSTLLKLLAGQTRPSTGRVAHSGRDLADYPARDLARRIAYMPQITPPAEGMRLSELVALGRYPWRGALGRFRAEDHAAVASAMNRCGVGELADRLVDTLSGGERQRGWIAMMLAQGAETLLMDEPTSALDVAHQVEVLGLVQQMCRDTGLSAVIVLHDVNMAARYCDTVVALESGRLILEGPIAKLMSVQALGRIYGLPMHVARQGDHLYALPE